MNWIVKWFMVRKLKEVLNMGALSGYKTYIIMGAFVVWSGLMGAGLITKETYEIGLGILNGLGLGALRSGMSAVEK